MSARRRTTRLLGLLALVAHVALPHLHASQLGAEARPCSESLRPAAFAGPDLIAGARGDSPRDHHDAAGCPVCRTLAHHGAMVDAPASPGIALASVPAPALAAGVVRTPDLGARSSRSPPVAV